MAIVKFISNQDCHIFIDKENVGKVTADSLLKAVLEVGGYLIEVKDDGGRILKKYNLEIKSTDNQILQDVSGASPSTDEVLNLLKNDPTLVFHCGRAKFCLDGKYGYVNKKFEVVIPAIYSIANDFVNNKAFVVRDFPDGRRTTMIDEDGNMFFNRWFDYIGESDETILLGIDKRIIVYSKKKFDKIAEYYNAGYNFKYPLVPVYINDGLDEFYGFIDFEGKEVVPLLYDRVENFDSNGYADVSFWGIKTKINKDDFSLEDDFGYKHEIKNFEDLVDTYNHGSFNFCLDRIEIFKNDTRKYITIHPLFNAGKWHLQIITESQYDTPQKITVVDCDRIIYLGDRCYVYRIENRCIVHYFDLEEDVIVDAKFVIPANGCVRATGCAYDEYYPDTFITRINGKYGSIDKNGKEIFPNIYNFIIPIQPDYFIDIYTKLSVLAVMQLKDRFSIANLSEGKIYLPFVFDEITKINRGVNLKDTIFLLSKTNRHQLFSVNKEKFTEEYDNLIICKKNNIVFKGECCGIIDDYGMEIIPIKSHIVKIVDEKDKSYFKIKNDGLYALGKIETGEFLTEHIYDDISLLCGGKHMFLVRIGSKYGSIDYKGRMVLPIRYDKIEADSDFWFPGDDYFVTLYERSTIIRQNLNDMFN